MTTYRSRSVRKPCWPWSSASVPSRPALLRIPPKPSSDRVVRTTIRQGFREELMRRRLSVAASVLSALFLFSPVVLGEPPTFTVGTASAAQGHRATGFIEVPPGVDPGLRIPVLLLHGAWPGPALAVVAGAHGTEYASILAVERLADRVD